MKREVIQGALENVLLTIENLDKKSVLDVFAREGDWNSHLIFNVSIKPFKAENYKEYKNQRKLFYKTSETTLDYLTQFYKNLFGINNSDSISIFPREKFNSMIYLYFFIVKVD